uniref:Integration host factor subunit beta n=1 Tax=candidate division WOR-3 bacterium TaxID=2052148 RepID=A0A7C4TF67_UNCW3
MRREFLIEKMAERFGSIYPKVDIEKLIDGFLDLIIELLIRDKRVELRRFGTFELRKRPGRVSKSPKTGQEFNLPDRYVPFFKPSKLLKKEIMEKVKP